MFARQFRKIIPSNLLLGGLLMLSLVVAVFVLKTTENITPSFFIEPLLIGLALLGFAFELIWLEAKSTTPYFKSFPLLAFGLVLLWLPFETITLKLILEAAVFFWVFDRLVRLQKKDHHPQKAFYATLVGVLLVLYNPLQTYFLGPLFLLFIAPKMNRLSVFIAVLLPLILVPFFVHSALLYGKHEFEFSLLHHFYDPLHFEKCTPADFIWFFFVFVVLIMFRKVVFSRKAISAVQITLGLFFWLLATLLVGFLMKVTPFGRWEWAYFPVALTLSHILNNIESNRTVNLLLSFIFVGGLLLQIFIL